MTILRNNLDHKASVKSATEPNTDTIIKAATATTKVISHTTAPTLE